MKTVLGAAIITALVLTQHACPQEPVTLEQLEKQRRQLEQQLSLLEVRQLLSVGKTSSKSNLPRQRVAAELRSVIVEFPNTPDAKEAAELLGKIGPIYFDGISGNCITTSAPSDVSVRFPAVSTAARLRFRPPLPASRSPLLTLLPAASTSSASSHRAVA
jgi:hypothetical protein